MRVMASNSKRNKRTPAEPVSEPVQDSTAAAQPTATPQEPARPPEPEVAPQYGEWADAAQLASMVTDVEAQLNEIHGPDEIELPTLFFIVLDPDGTLGMIHVPFTGQDIARLGGDEPRTAVGRTMVMMAVNMLRLPPVKLRADLASFYREGQKLLFAALIADAYETTEKPPKGITDYAQLPPDKRRDIRIMTACDGRGNTWYTSRVIGDAAPVQLDHMICLPDLDRPILMRYDEDSPANRAQGLLPWALAAMAVAYRDVFQDKIEVKRS